MPKRYLNLHEQHKQKQQQSRKHVDRGLLPLALCANQVEQVLCKQPQDFKHKLKPTAVMMRCQDRAEVSRVTMTATATVQQKVQTPAVKAESGREALWRRSLTPQVMTCTA